MMRMRMIMGEAWRSLTASMSTTIAATMTVLVALFVLGSTIGLGTWVLSYRDHIKKQLLVKVYFKLDAYPATDQPGGREVRSQDQPARPEDRLRL